MAGVWPEPGSIPESLDAPLTPSGRDARTSLESDQDYPLQGLLGGAAGRLLARDNRLRTRSARRERELPSEFGTEVGGTSASESEDDRKETLMTVTTRSSLRSLNGFHQ